MGKRRKAGHIQVRESARAGTPQKSFDFQKKVRARNIWFGACCYVSLVFILKGVFSLITTYVISFCIAVTAVITYKCIGLEDETQPRLKVQ